MKAPPKFGPVKIRGPARIDTFLRRLPSADSTPNAISPGTTIRNQTPIDLDVDEDDEVIEIDEVIELDDVATGPAIPATPTFLPPSLDLHYSVDQGEEAVGVEVKSGNKFELQ